MNRIFLATALIAMTAPAFAETRIVLGCEVIQAANGNYFYKVDPTCAFDRTGLGEQGDGKPLPVAELPVEEEPADDAKS